MANKHLNELRAYIDSNWKKESFPHALNRLIEEKAKQPSEVYKKAGVDRRYYSKIRNEPDRKVSKQIAIGFGLALELNRAEMDELLESAGFSLSRNSRFDLIIMFCVEHHIYDPHAIDDLICEYNKIFRPIKEDNTYIGKENDNNTGRDDSWKAEKEAWEKDQENREKLGNTVIETLDSINNVLDNGVWDALGFIEETFFPEGSEVSKGIMSALDDIDNILDEAIRKTNEIL